MGRQSKRAPMRLLRNMPLVGAVVSAMAAAADGIDALTRFYRDVDSLSAHVGQTQKAADGAVLRESSRLFLLSRPGGFRWEYKERYRQIMVSDGQLSHF